MRGLIVSVALLVCVLSGQVSTGGEKPAKPDSPPSLQELLNKAKQNNPAIKLAELKVKEAELILANTRTHAQNKVAGAHADLQALIAVLELESARLKRAEALVGLASISPEEFGMYALAKKKIEAEIGRKEAEMPYLLGEQPAATAWKKLAVGELTKKASRDNPEVRLAEGQVAVSILQLEKTRLRELNKIAVLVGEIGVFQATLKEAKARFDRAKALFDQNTISREEYSTYEQAHQKARQELRAAEIRLPQLLGEVAQDPDTKK